MTTDDKKYTAVHYSQYLALDRLLSAQNLRSEELGTPAHDEMLFIIVHQVYELWFKEIIHDLESVIGHFEQGYVDEKNIRVAVQRLNRIVEIQKLLIDQIRVMETMTPLDFLDFRNYLFPASGFQSFQFRYIEVLLGLKSADRLTYNQAPYTSVFSEAERNKLMQLEAGKSMLEVVQDWLERTPFLEFKGFSFLPAYRDAVERMLSREKTAILESSMLTDEEKAMRIRMMGDADSWFASVLDENVHAQLISEGKCKLSYRATVAALLINLYRDEPILQMPFMFISKLVDVDEMLTMWRYRHAQMVMRMLGRKIGTGGSSGYDYLQATASRHHILNDFHNISTLLIPRSELPVLPDEVKKGLNFYYSEKHKNT